jgi:ABC-type multidrug transport system fused ATPase/permease subunit
MSSLKKILNIFKLLNFSNKFQVYLVFLLITLIAILEVISLGLFLPIITNILNNDNELIFFNFLKNYELFFLLNIFFIFFIIKSALNIYLIKKQINIKNSITVNFISSYFENILKKNILFFKKNNLNFLIKNIINEAPELVNNIIYASLLLITDFFILSLIVIFILINFTSITLYIFPFFFFFYLIYLKFFKNSISEIGKKRFNLLQECIQYLSNGFGSIVEIKLTQSEKKFSKNFRVNSNKLYQLNGMHAFLQNIPKYIMEITIIFIFLSISLFFDFFKLNIKELLTFASVILVASLRIMPCLSRIISSIQSIQYSYPAYINLEKQINKDDIDIASDKKIFFQKNLKLKNLSFKYENSEIILNNINCEFTKGQIIGIVGKNGSGKSTLLNIIMGLIKVDHEIVFVDDQKNSLHNTSWYEKISYCSNQSFLLDSTIENNIAFEMDSNNIDRKKLQYSINFLDYQNFIAEFPNGLKTYIGQNGSKISSGQKQKICLLRAFYFDTEIMVFDEALNSIDEESVANFLKKLSNLKKDKTIFIVSHDIKNLSLCDQIISLDINKK